MIRQVSYHMRSPILSTHKNVNKNCPSNAFTAISKLEIVFSTIYLYQMEDTK